MLKVGYNEGKDQRAGGKKRANLSASLEKRVKVCVIFTVMNECPYCLPWQGLLSCELLAIPAASIL